MQEKVWRRIQPQTILMDFVWFDSLNDGYDYPEGMTPMWTSIWCPSGKRATILNRYVYSRNCISASCLCHGAFAVCNLCFSAATGHCSGRDAIHEPPRTVAAPLCRFLRETPFDLEKARKASNNLRSIDFLETNRSFYKKMKTEADGPFIYHVHCLWCGSESICIF